MIPAHIEFSSLENVNKNDMLDDALYVLTVPNTEYVVILIRGGSAITINVEEESVWRLCENCIAERCGETVRVVKGHREGIVEFYNFVNGSLNFIRKQQIRTTPHKGLIVDSINPIAVFCDKYETVALVRIDYVTEEDSDEIALSEYVAVSIDGETVEVDLNIDENFIIDARPLGLIRGIPVVAATACDDFTCNVENAAVAFYDGDSIKINYITDEHIFYANAARQGFITQLVSGPYPYVTLVPDYEENAVVGKYLSEEDARKIFSTDPFNVNDVVVINGVKSPSIVLASLGKEIIGRTVFHNTEWSEIYSLPLNVDGLDSLDTFSYADLDQNKNRIVMISDGKIWVGQMEAAKLIEKYG